ncbi:unnamed protein product [Lymnaea stagnalis]|uniref:GH18 domain-containing protein n=1 Tax=Lymnaea stagnalis TaxID=6523 RepID=A0AAV2H532_LYMST
MFHLILFSLIVSSGAQEKSCKRIVCLVDNLDNPKDFIVDGLPTDYCTHFIYDSAYILGNTLMHKHSYELFRSKRKGLYRKLNGQKRDKPGLITLLRVSPPKESNEPFSTMVGTVANRQAFITAAIAYLKKYRFDGLEINWPRPGEFGGKAEDKTNYSAFLKEFSEALQKEAATFKRPRLLLWAVVHPYYFDLIEVDEMAKYLDMANVITYGLRGFWDYEMDHHSPLRGWFGVASIMEDWMRRGMPALKLNLGISMSGVYCHVKNKTDHSRLGNYDFNQEPVYTKYNRGGMAFTEICLLTIDQQYVHRDEYLSAPYFFREGLWLGYDDRLSVYEKGKYAKENDLGVWVRNVQMDDYNGTMCGMGKYPLIRSIFSGCSMSF